MRIHATMMRTLRLIAQKKAACRSENLQAAFKKHTKQTKTYGGMPCSIDS